MPVRDMLPPRYRGFLEVDTAICTGCQACERACPINCIQISLEKDPRTRSSASSRSSTSTRRSACSAASAWSPARPAPSSTPASSRRSHRHIRNLTFRWSDPLKPFPVYKVDKNAEYYPRVPLGSLVRARLETLAWNAPAPVFLPPEPPGAAKPAAQPKAAAAAAAVAPAKAAAPAPKAAPTNGVARGDSRDARVVAPPGGRPRSRCREGRRAREGARGREGRRYGARRREGRRGAGRHPDPRDEVRTRP